MQIPGISGEDVHTAATASVAMTSIGIPLTGKACQQDLLLDLGKDEWLNRKDTDREIDEVVISMRPQH